MIVNELVDKVKNRVQDSHSSTTPPPQLNPQPSRRSYVNAAVSEPPDVPPKASVKPTSSVLDAVPSSAFFNPPSIASTSKPRKPLLRPSDLPPPKPRKDKAPARKPYIEIDTEDDNDELALSPAVSSLPPTRNFQPQPRGRQTSAFSKPSAEDIMQSIQPGGSGERKRGIDPSISSSSELTLEDEDHSVEDGDGDGDAAAREANLVSPGQRQTSFVRSTSASTSRAAQKNAHATYGRSTSFVSKSDKNSIRPLPIDFSSDAEDSVSDSSTKANRSLNALALVPSRKQTWDDDVNRGRGWTLPKLFAWAHDDGGEKGLWETGVWDVEVMDPPIGDPKAKYLPLGTWVDGITPASGTELESKEEDQAMEVEATVKGTKAGEEDVKMTSPTHESASAPNAENFPTSTWSHSSRRRPWRTLTRVELEQARPHPYAYYSRPDHSWCIFAPLRSSSSSSATPRDQSQPDLWHWGPSMSFHDLPGPSLSLPIPAADPASIPPMYSEKKKTTLNQVSGGLKGLKGLRSLSGRTAIISENSNWYPSVIPRELWDDFVKKFEGFPSNGEGKNDPATGAVNVVFRSVCSISVCV